MTTSETVIGTLTVPWIPVPHSMDLLLAEVPPADHVVITAFVLVVDDAGRTLLTHVNRPGRGWDVPGGHVDPGEDPGATAVRELAEETGLALPPERLSLLGGQRITLLTAPPDGYPYPDRAFMAFYAARLEHPGEPTAPDPRSECDRAEWVDPGDVPLRCPGAAWLPLHAALAR